MLKKLMRYDLENIFKFLCIFYSLATVFSILARLTANLGNSLMLNIISEICVGAAISMMCSTLINNVMRMWVRFKYNLYGDESYLSHTLPVTKSTHYLSKILTTVITLFTSFLVVGAMLFVMYYSKENIQMIKGFLTPLATLYDSSVVVILIVFIFVLFIEFINILQCGFTGIILGHRMNNAKVGFSVLYGFISFFVSQTAVLAIVFVIALFNKDFMALFTGNAVISIDVIKVVLLVSILSYTFINIALCFINIKLFKKGVNVD